MLLKKKRISINTSMRYFSFRSLSSCLRLCVCVYSLTLTLTHKIMATHIRPNTHKLNRFARLHERFECEAVRVLRFELQCNGSTNSTRVRTSEQKCDYSNERTGMRLLEGAIIISTLALVEPQQPQQPQASESTQLTVKAAISLPSTEFAVVCLCCSFSYHCQLTISPVLCVCVYVLPQCQAPPASSSE